MHLIIIIVFAATLWFENPATLNYLGLSHIQSVSVVLMELTVLAVAAWLATRRTLKVLANNPYDPDKAQHHYHIGNLRLQIMMLLFYLGNLMLTSWPAFVEERLEMKKWVGLSDLMILAPFVINLLLLWVIQYPADRAIRQMALSPRLAQAHPVHPVWTLGQYLSFNIRHQFLTIAAPMVLIVMADEWLDYTRPRLTRWINVFWIDDVLMGLLVCMVFVFAPVMLRYIWTTQPMPAGDLRTRLEQVAKRMNLKYRQILIWHSRGMIVNAAVMGIFPPVRYVLISDGLLESMNDRQIEGVFGHEAGHVKHRHIPYFILFALLSMFIAGGLTYALFPLQGKYLAADHIQLIVGLAMILFWGLAFGWLSHQFEFQADMAGAISITPEQNHCHLPCLVHSFSDGTPQRSLLCMTAAEQFGGTLTQVGLLNGIPLDEMGWRHPSINHRIVFLRRLAQDMMIGVEFIKRIRWIKIWLVAGFLIGLVLNAYLYRDWLWPKNWAWIPF